MPRPTALRVGLLEDQPLFREMLCHLLDAVPGIEVAPAASCAETVEWQADRLDAAVLDVELPDGTGLEVGRDLRRANAGIGIVLLSAIDRSQILLELDDDERERWSFLSKRSSTSASILIRTIRAAAAGRCVIDPEAVAAREARAGGRLSGLSARQLEVLRLLAEGLTNQAIAERLGIALNSASNHVNAIYAALDIDRETRNPRVTAVRIFLEETA